MAVWQVPQQPDFRKRVTKTIIRIMVLIVSSRSAIAFDPYHSLDVTRSRQERGMHEL